MSIIVVTSVSAGLAGPILETRYGPNLGDGPFGLPRLFGLTPLALTGISFWILTHGLLKVGKARKKYSDLAKKDGEKDVDERYALPNLYAQGTSKHAKAFNCVQRSHQQIFETFPQHCLLSMVGALHYPISTACSTLVYAAGRITMSRCYAAADGDPKKRYTSKLSRLVWYGHFATVIIAGISSASLLAGGPIL